MNKKHDISSLSAIGAALGAEGFSDHVANEVKRYWQRRCITERGCERVNVIKKAFGEMVAAKLSAGDRIVLGKWISVLCRAEFDTGLRLGLMTLVAELEGK